MSKKIKGEQKKFLGETLNQYDKALDEAINQLDKKNREQNHKISSLTNSFDNEYLEKDVEGNMTALENSKDGMVINQFVGNSVSRAWKVATEAEKVKKSSDALQAINIIMGGLIILQNTA